MKTEGYKSEEHYDEMFTPEGVTRAHYLEFYETLKKKYS
jgi:uncharacterized circularly permuted ATP-grasp superfamily protein